MTVQTSASPAFVAADWSELSPQQQDVVRWVYEGKGSLELLARAGCGKTYTLMKVVKAIADAALGEAAVMAYNKKIADEIKDKLATAGFDTRIAQAGTVHSFGFGAWRRVAPKVKVDNKKLANLINDASFTPGGEILDRVGDVVAKLVSLGKQRAIGHLQPIEDRNAWLDIWEHFGLDDDLADANEDSTNPILPIDVVRQAQRIYRTSLNKCREVIDFDDMILAPLYFQARFWTKDWILLDEAQDTNPARRALALAMLKPGTGRLIFVGDPAQAIYGFTGADSDSMDQLKRATEAVTLPLNVTRRCPKSVVALAAALVPDFVAHESAPEGTVRSIKESALAEQNLALGDAILCRNTAPLIRTAYGLIAKGIACVVEGREIGKGLIKLARRWKIKQLDALLNKLEEHLARQTAKFMSKGQENRIDGVADQVECLRIIIARCLIAKKQTIDELVAEIETIFGDDGSNRGVTLSTVHRSKGREWRRVFIFGRRFYMPSPYARKDWQREQERNLEYVALTRAIDELVDVEVELIPKPATSPEAPR